MAFFDSLRKTVTKTTKDVVKVSGDAVEFTILKFKIGEINDKIDQAYTEIGKEVYKSSVVDHFDADFVNDKCDYITNLKIEKAKEMLKDTNMSASEIAKALGFENYPYFCKLFKRKTGKRPTEYRKK